MKTTILSPTDYAVSNWSGGETTEVFLFPPDGDYGKRQFDYRLSTAKVLLPESEFTDLPGYQRIIMSLDNPLELHHRSVKGSRIEQLKAFETGYFSGEDKTKSFGQCQDFNLIYLPSYKGNMFPKYNKNVTLLETNVTYIYYALEETKCLILEQNKSEIVLNPKETLILTDITTTNRITFFSEMEDSLPCVIEVSIR